MPSSRFIAALSISALLGPSPAYAQTKAAGDSSIRPFTVHVPQTALNDLRRRLAATRWPDTETVADRSQGAQLAQLQALVKYWGTGYDWRRLERKLNALPQFTTNIDGIDIHFIHVKSRHPNALPLLITHGWPGSVIEQLKIIGPLTDPTAHEVAPRTHSTSLFRRYRATASRGDRPRRAGEGSVSVGRGTSS